MPSRALSVARRLTTPAELSATATALLSSTAMPILRSSPSARTGRVALRIGDCDPLARDQAGDIGEIRAVDRPGGVLGADENQAVAQRAADGGALDDLGAGGLLGRGAGERKNYVAARAAIDLGKGGVGRRDEDVDARAGARLPQRAGRFQRLLQGGLTVDHEIPRTCTSGSQECDGAQPYRDDTKQPTSRR